MRVSESGLGCGPAGSGFHGWPFCNGDAGPRPRPQLDHRVLAPTVAAIVGLMMLALAVLAWRRIADSALVLAAIVAVVLVVAQGLLGRLTVEHNLEERLGRRPPGLAMVLLALLHLHLAPRDRSDRRRAGSTPGHAASRSPGRLRGLFLHDRRRRLHGRDAEVRPRRLPAGDGAHHACGNEFPTCNGAFMPFGDARLVDIHLTHRVLPVHRGDRRRVLAVMALRRGDEAPAYELCAGCWWSRSWSAR